MIDDEALKMLIYDLWRLWDIGERIGYTEGIANYYERLSKEVAEPRSSIYLNVADSMRGCHKVFDTLTWNRQKTKAIERVNLCKNKFCSNCVKLIQATRLKRMYGAIREAERTKCLYHTVWTVPNVRGEELPQALSAMNDAFSTLVRYFSVRKKIKGLDFSRYGFYAAVKSIECTYKNNGYYHPHFHAIFAFDSPFPTEGDMINKFSRSNSHPRYAVGEDGESTEVLRTFSEDVVLMQKLWRLLYDFRRTRDEKVRKLNAAGFRFVPYNDVTDFESVGDGVILDPIKKKYTRLRNAETVQAERVTLDKINELDLGYSVIFDAVDGNSCYEVFKYAFKCMSENQSLMSYVQFKTLRSTFYHKQTIQTYGAWHNICVDDDIDEDVSDAYRRYVDELNRNESPERRVERLTDILRSGEEYGYTIISSSDLNQYLPAKAEIESARATEGENGRLNIRFYEKNPVGKKREKILRRFAWRKTKKQW